MLTQNFYSQLAGGGSSSSARKMNVINTSKVRATVSSGFISVLARDSSNAYSFSSSGTDISRSLNINGGYTEDTGFTLNDTIYTEKDVKVFCTEAITLFPIVDNTTSISQVTGVKITSPYTNKGTTDITINYLILKDIVASSPNIIALSLLDAPVTIKPTETFVLEYVLDNLYPVTPDTVQ